MAGDANIFEDATSNAPGANAPNTPIASAGDTDKPDVDQARAALVKKTLANIHRGKKMLKDAFEQMREDMRFAGGKQYDGQKKDDDRYILNIIQRYINQRVAVLYAKNPRVVAKRRPKIDFKIWDETPESMQEAMMVLQGAQDAANEGVVSGDPHAITAHNVAMSDAGLQSAMALLQDIWQGYQYRKMLDKVSKTLEFLFTYFMQAQQPRFKSRLKKMVKRTVTTGVGYIRLGFLRETQRPDGYQEQLAEMSKRLAHLTELQKELAEGEIDETDAEMEELKLAMAALQAQPDVIVRAGLTFDFPQSTKIIFDPKCTQLVDWIGADWVAEEYVEDKEAVEERFSIELGDKYIGYADENGNQPAQMAWGNFKASAKAGNMVCWWRYYHKPSGLVMCVADGYPDFLCEPAAPEVNLERFFPIWALVFNEMESEEKVIPDSDVRLLRSAQKEFNRTKEALRQHRIANAPRWVSTYGALDEDDKNAIANLSPHQVVQIKAIQGQDDIRKIIQALPKDNIDPNLYETGQIINDTFLATGAQQANIGGTSGDTATETSIAESSSQTAGNSNVDELDDLLSDLARCGGQVLLTEMDQATVEQIVGPGAVWPQFTADDIAKELYLEVEAGSSGAPNKAEGISNFQRLYPFLLQAPNMDPLWLLRYAIKLMDDKMDPTDAILAGAASIMAQNTAMSAQLKGPAAGGGQPAPSSPGDNAPNAQGAAGGQNAEQPAGQPSPGVRPPMPAAGEGSRFPNKAAAA